MVKILFVCLGNICRSPMAEAIFRKKVKDQGLDKIVTIDSAGTGRWHIGNPPHEGTIEILKQNQIDASGLKARQVSEDDLQSFDYVIGMDTENVGNLRALAGHHGKAEVARLLDFIPNYQLADVPDPYFTGNFEEVFDLISDGCDHLLSYIREKEQI
ncbi:low molecular weight protein-tyrosine-phosphatase [Halalkalibacterium ligniniphilum]|uniref:low molecular weight protein-tyrosine-phosphatase n=1 Tax=Halalkalibacterium ligniniphilum TaxID=1134413 RepID=UPI00034A1130|nr:low molecular weight protein-tyrosine-phosphatase [Halalkalibacterium ligniniphilum]